MASWIHGVAAGDILFILQISSLVLVKHRHSLLNVSGVLYVSISDTNTCKSIQLTNLLKLLSVLTCQCRNRVSSSRLYVLYFSNKRII